MSGCILSQPLCWLKYGAGLTRQRSFWFAVKCGFLGMLIGSFHVYAFSPNAQGPNRDTLQFVGWEQGFKNYIDRKYNLYENADKMFYESLMCRAEAKQLRAELLPGANERIKTAQNAYS